MIENEITRDATGEELYQRFRCGDEQAYEKLVGIYRESLTKYICRFINDAHDAEELMIDTFAELAICTKFAGKSSLKTYLFSIGRNIAIKHLKKFNSKKCTPIGDADDMPIEYDNFPELDFIRKEQGGQLHSAMWKLKQDYREVLHLIYFENMSYSDAGTAMGKSVRQITNLTHRAKASLKTLLESEDAGI